MKLSFDPSATTIAEAFGVSGQRLPLLAMMIIREMMSCELASEVISRVAEHVLSAEELVYVAYMTRDNMDATAQLNKDLRERLARAIDRGATLDEVQKCFEGRSLQAAEEKIMELGGKYCTCIACQIRRAAEKNRGDRQTLEEFNSESDAPSPKRRRSFTNPDRFNLN